MKLMLDVAKRELHEVTVQLRDLEPILNNQSPPAHASSTPEAISAVGSLKLGHHQTSAGGCDA
jgi:hypothetical protein